MDITGPLFHVASELQLKEIFAQMPIMVLTSTNICLKMNTNALFGTIVVYQVNNIHFKKTFRKCFHTIAPEDNIRLLWSPESIIYVLNMYSKIHFLFYVSFCLNYFN